jgi:hypothetical protein
MSLDELATIDLPEDDAQHGDGLPRIWWKYGTAPKESGHFYTRAQDWDGDLPDPWVPCELYEGEDGWAARRLRLILVTKRSQPYLKVNVGGKDYRRYADWPRRGSPWPSGMQILTEYVCFAEGLGGPVVFSFHGATGQAMEGKSGIVPTAAAALAREASRIYKRRIGLSAFWVPIGPTMKDGKPHFEKLPQGTKLNYPALQLPDKTGKDLLTACYVGSEALGEVRVLKDAYADWAKELRGNDDIPADQPAPGPARNEPVAYDDDDVF